MLRLINY